MNEWRVERIDSKDSLNLAIDGLYERFETAFVRRTLREGQSFVDLGAHIGYYSRLAASIVGPMGEVFAFEPAPENFELLKANVAAFPWARHWRAAAGSEPGRARLFLSKENSGDHRLFPTAGRESVEVEVVSVDSVAAVRKIDFFKIDVQGCEIEALQGMAGKLEASPEAVGIVEYWPAGLKANGHRPEDLWKTLVGMGFRVYVAGHKKRLASSSWPCLMKVKAHINLFVSKKVLL